MLPLYFNLVRRSFNIFKIVDHQIVEELTIIAVSLNRHGFSFIRQKLSVLFLFSNNNKTFFFFCDEIPSCACTRQQRKVTTKKVITAADVAA